MLYLRVKEPLEERKTEKLKLLRNINDQLGFRRGQINWKNKYTK